MTCPQCHQTPVPLIAYFLFGWKYIRCKHCGAQLVLKSFGRRFWRVVSLGILLIAFEWFLFENFAPSVSVDLALAFFVVTLVIVIYASLAVGWKDAIVQLR